MTEDPIGTYYIHHNYDRPFRVVITSPDNNMAGDDEMDGDVSTVNVQRIYHVRVYESTGYNYTLEMNQYSNHPCMNLDTNQIFIGKSPRNATTSNGGYGPDFDGNTILFRWPSNETSAGEHLYVYIGENIVKFNAKGRIVKYRSDVGNNDVPYPFAVDEYGYIYLLAENVVIAPSPVNTIDEIDDDYDIYDYYYDKCKMVTISGEEQDRRMYMGIHSLWVNGVIFMMTYRPEQDANNTYDILTSEGELYAKINSVKVPLSKERYLELMRNYGIEHGFEQLDIFEGNSTSGTAVINRLRR